MKVYDKAMWHIDGGEEKEDVIKRFKVVFNFLNSNNMLNDDGLEVWEYCMDESVSLHTGLLNKKGINFLDQSYDNIIKVHPQKLGKVLSDEYDNFIKK